MCYPKPGPRCSRHAYERLQTARTAVLDAQRALTAAHETEFANVRRSQPVPTADMPLSEYERHLIDAVNDSESTDAVQAATAALDRATSQLADAQEQFNATPDGIRTLEQQITAARTPALVSDLIFRLERGKARRHRQIADYRASTYMPVEDMSMAELREEMSLIQNGRLPQAEDQMTRDIELARLSAVSTELDGRSTANRAIYEAPDLPRPGWAKTVEETHADWNSAHVLHITTEVSDPEYAHITRARLEAAIVQHAATPEGAAEMRAHYGDDSEHVHTIANGERRARMLGMHVSNGVGRNPMPVPINDLRNALREDSRVEIVPLTQNPDRAEIATVTYLSSTRVKTVNAVGEEREVGFANTTVMLDDNGHYILFSEDGLARYAMRRVG